MNELSAGRNASPTRLRRNLEHVWHHSRGIRLTDLTGAYKTPITRSLKACTAYPAGPVHEHSQRTDTQKSTQSQLSHEKRPLAAPAPPPARTARSSKHTHGKPHRLHSRIATDKQGGGSKLQRRHPCRLCPVVGTPLICAAGMQSQWQAARTQLPHAQRKRTRARLVALAGR